MYEWWVMCLTCGLFEKTESEYIGGNKWFCKCGSRHIKGGFIFEPKEETKCEQ